jgi:tRNA(Ile)-lysidine synthase
MKRRVSATIRRRALLAPGDRVAVAVSGGPDSVALAWLLHDLQPTAEWTVAGLIHVNHQLRGAESDADEAFCRDLAARLGWPIEVRAVDVRGAARSTRRSTETTARDLRYAAFEDAADALGASVIATGHSLDDQAETVLMRLLAGAGTRGLSGVRPKRARYRRPLIDCRRDALRDWLVARAEPFRTDTSNDDVSIPRNRLRHELMPAVVRIAPGGVRALARLADLAADDEAALEGRAIELLPAIVSIRAGGVQVSTEGLAALPPAIARRVVRAAVRQAAPGARPGAGHLETVRRLAASEKTGGRLDLPGLTVTRRAATIAIVHAAAPAGPASRAFEYALPVPGSVHVPEAGVDVVAAIDAHAATDRLRASATRVALQASALALPLVVRNRRAGDRMRPLGAPGRRKLQDVFVDRKVPRQDRDRVPVVVDRSGRIVWVAGLAVADECRVTAPETGVVILELRNNR